MNSNLTYNSLNLVNQQTPAWVIITGASAGFGKEFAKQLALYGFKFILTARRKNKLDELAEELAKVYDSQCLVFPADLANEDEVDSFIRFITENTIEKSEPISMLINNAGFGSRGFFIDSIYENQLKMHYLHVITPFKLTHALLPHMVKAKSGAIINVSSLGSFAFTKSAVSYCATKAYLRVFSQTLAMELKNTGVKIQALCPGFTYTEFHEVGEYKGFNKNTYPRFLWMKTPDVIKSSIKALTNNKLIVIPGFKNKLIKTLVRTPLIGRLLLLLVNNTIKKEV